METYQGSSITPRYEGRFSHTLEQGDNLTIILTHFQRVNTLHTPLIHNYRCRCPSEAELEASVSDFWLHSFV